MKRVLCYLTIFIILTSLPISDLKMDKYNKINDGVVVRENHSLIADNIYPSAFSSDISLIWNFTYGFSALDWGTAVALDNQKNVLFVGVRDTYHDNFIRKYYPNGTLIWSKNWDKNAQDDFLDAVIDKNNNIYLCGRTGSWGYPDKIMLLVKFDPNGNEIWHREWSGSNDLGGRQIALDSNENVYVLGRCLNNDSYVRRYDPEGNLIWSVEWGNGASNYENRFFYGIEIDNYDNIIITGRYDTLSENKNDMFLIKLNSEGHILWETTWGYDGEERGHDLVIDSKDNYYITCFSLTTNILYLVKYNSSGHQIWNKTLGTFSSDSGFKMKIDDSDIIYMTGTYIGKNNDLFLMVLNTTGTIYRQINWTLANNEMGFDIALDQENQVIYITGCTTSIGNGDKDALFIKYKILNKKLANSPICINNNWTDAVIAGIATGSGTYSDPYIIENLIIDGGTTGTCIDILNSDVYFIIRNCTCFNSLSGSIGTDPFYHAGIRLYNVSNAKLINNNCSNNRFTGIRLYYDCDNNTIIGNIANNNPDAGIIIRNDCNNNTIINNTCNGNSQWGIELSFNSDDNIITRNRVNSNDKVGIQINTDCDDNLINNNAIIGNLQNAKDDGINNSWDNGSIGNYWDDYSGADADDDGIGDTPYNIPGIAGSQDHYPVWDDGDNTPPCIIIHNPKNYKEFGRTAPEFNITIIDNIGIHIMWYTLDNGINNYTFTTNGSINQNAWDLKPNGYIVIRFYANDTAGNLNF
ncbi:MAG: NosD domain-containing protein [Candidatus Helarchaeota archaeon]